MARRPGLARIRHAKLMGTAMGVRDKVMLGDADLMARHREEWTALWARLDDLIDHLDKPSTAEQVPRH